MVFRRDNRDRNPEAFSRQLDNLRQQSEARADNDAFDEDESDYPYADEAPREQAARTAPTAYGRGFEDGPADEPGYATPNAPFTTNQPTSVIAADTVWRGDLESNGDVHVHGHMQGSITSRTDIYVSEDAEADATLAANAIVIAGNVRGTVRATSRLEVLPQGRINGEIIAPTIVAHDGCRINAAVRMTLTPDEQAGTPVRVSTTSRRRPGSRL